MAPRSMWLAAVTCLAACGPAAEREAARPVVRPLAEVPAPKRDLAPRKLAFVGVDESDRFATRVLVSFDDKLVAIDPQAPEHVILGKEKEDAPVESVSVFGTRCDRAKDGRVTCFERSLSTRRPVATTFGPSQKLGAAAAWVCSLDQEPTHATCAPLSYAKDKFAPQRIDAPADDPFASIAVVSHTSEPSLLATTKSRKLLYVSSIAKPSAPRVLADGVVDLASGEGYGCAVTREGAVVCFGYLFPPAGWTAASASAPAPKKTKPTASAAREPAGGPVLVALAGVSDAKRVFTARRHLCVLRAGGTAACFGENGEGALGATQAAPGSLPRSPGGLARIDDLLAYPGGTCVLHDGAIDCMGGHGALVPTPPTKSALLGEDAIAIASGHDVACVLGNDGRVGCMSPALAAPKGVDGSEWTSLRASPLAGERADGLFAGERSVCVTQSGDLRCFRLDGNRFAPLMAKTAAPKLVAAVVSDTRLTGLTDRGTVENVELPLAPAERAAIRAFALPRARALAPGAVLLDDGRIVVPNALDRTSRDVPELAGTTATILDGVAMSKTGEATAWHIGGCPGTPLAGIVVGAMTGGIAFLFERPRPCPGGPKFVSRRVPELDGAKAIARGPRFACKIQANGEAECVRTGANVAGGHLTYRFEGASADDPAVAMTGGNDHACLLTRAGKAYCTGTMATGAHDDEPVVLPELGQPRRARFYEE